jgi:alpha,alpha-trehalose phosphorylase
MYTLLASAGKDGIGNIASKGLSGEGYEGHYFWDTEIYMFPFFLLTDQELARQLLLSRARMLPGARAHAREMGHVSGALYAWRTITGSECSSYFPSGSAQYHINSAIAHAFLSYWQVSGDLPFMADTGAEVLIETARLWLDAGHWYEGQFRIDSVTGPDEYSCIVNNNYYTNRSAQAHLQGLVRLCQQLRESGLLEPVREKTGLAEEELVACAKAAEAMYLPFDECLGISAQDDSFLKKERLNLSGIPRENFPLLMHYHPLFLYRHQVCKQADTVLSHFLYEEGEKEEVIRKSFAYYEELTTHDSSLSECVFSMMAARVGDAKKAYEYYRRSAALDLENTHGNTADGIHAANMGGCWMGIVFGFGGLRLHREGLSLRPILPDGMKGYSFTITWKKTKMMLSITPEEVEILSEGPEIEVQLYGEAHRLNGRLHIPLRKEP